MIKYTRETPSCYTGNDNQLSVTIRRDAEGYWVAEVNGNEITKQASLTNAKDITHNFLHASRFTVGDRVWLHSSGGTIVQINERYVLQVRWDDGSIYHPGQGRMINGAWNGHVNWYLPEQFTSEPR